MKITPLSPRTHWSKPNLISFDVETIPDERFDLKKDKYQPLLFKLATVKCDNNPIEVCKSEKDLTLTLLGLCKSQMNNVIVSHNSQFDYSFVNHKLILKRFRLYKMAMTPFFVNFKSNDRHGRTNILFVDSMNYLRIGLKEIGELIGLEKLEIDFKTATYDELETYCKRDTEICYHFMEYVFEFHERYNVPFSITFPQFAYRTFRKHYLQTEIIISENLQVLQLERNSYKGGRVEAFDMRVYATLNCYDINSLYPFVMKDNLFPIKLRLYYNPEVTKMFDTERVIEKIINEECVIAKVVVDLPDEFIGRVPITRKNKLMFPTGRFETILCSPELRLIQDFIIEVKEFAVYESARIFTNYITDFYALRMKAKEKGQEDEQQMYKLFMNSLYGKFAQRKFVFSRCKELDDHFNYASAEVDGKNVHWFGGIAYRRDIKTINKFSSVAISSFVTSYARIHLYNMLTSLNNLVYCDTDSLLTTDDLKITKELGGLKLEKVYHNFQALGNKMYRADEVFKCKGVTNPRKALVEETNEHMRFEFERITKIQETIKRTGRPTPQLMVQKKEYKLHYDKRIINPNWTTQPIHLE